MPAFLAAAVFMIALAGQDPVPVQDSAAPPAPPPRKLELMFDSQGHVTLRAQQVTVTEILAEWSRKGGTKIQGAERLTGGPIQIPVLFENRPELEVIEALTRHAAGISVAPRRVGTTGASQFEMIHIVATSTATAASSYSSPTYGSNTPAPIRGFPDDEIAPIVAPGARDPQQQPQAPPPGAARPYGAPGSPMIVPVVPVMPVGGATTTPPPGRGGGGGTPPTTTGRGGGGGR